MDNVKMKPVLLKKWLIKRFGVAKLQQAFWCNWLENILSYAICQAYTRLFISMKGPKVTLRHKMQFVYILLVTDKAQHFKQTQCRSTIATDLKNFTEPNFSVQ